MPWHRADSNTLSRREIDVLKLLAQGKRDKEMAQALGISWRTVGHQVRSAMLKLDSDTRAQAVAIYVKRETGAH
jgi:DNA-binding CsgD family transcriptional regulator